MEMRYWVRHQQPDVGTFWQWLSGLCSGQQLTSVTVERDLDITRPPAHQ